MKSYFQFDGGEEFYSDKCYVITYEPNGSCIIYFWQVRLNKHPFFWPICWINIFPIDWLIDWLINETRLYTRQQQKGGQIFLFANFFAILSYVHNAFGALKFFS